MHPHDIQVVTADMHTHALQDKGMGRTILYIANHRLNHHTHAPRGQTLYQQDEIPNFFQQKIDQPRKTAPTKCAPSLPTRLLSNTHSKANTRHARPHTKHARLHTHTYSRQKVGRGLSSLKSFRGRSILFFQWFRENDSLSCGFFGE